MTSNPHLQLLLSLLKRVLLDPVARHAWSFTRRKLANICLLLSKMFRQFFWPSKDVKADRYIQKTSFTICASDAFPFFGTTNASSSSQDFGLTAIEEFALNDISSSPTDRETRGEISIVIDPPHDENDPIGQDCVQSPGEMVLNSMAEDVATVTTATLSNAHPSFYPTTPETIADSRYSREVSVPDEELEYKIEPLTTSFARDGLASGWKSYTHPEGVLYFFHKRLRIFTDADLYNPDICMQLHDHIIKLEDFMRANNLQLDPDVDTVLDFYLSESGKIYWCYYFASHKHRVVFWLDQFDAGALSAWQEVKGVTSASHLGHEIESQYWLHCQMYPNARKITCELVDELRDIIMHAICDTFTSRTSTAPYSNSDLHQLLSLTNGFRTSASRQNMIGTSASFGRLMYFFTRGRFYNRYGQSSARLDRNRSVHGQKTLVRSPLVRLLSPILFYGPDAHLQSIQDIWVDRLLHKHAWTLFTDKIANEWMQATVYATVLLNANVAFLAIQSVDWTSDSPRRSPAQIASYVSIATDIGCVLLGQLLLRRTKGRECMSEAVSLLKPRKHPTRGLEILAILYALPSALLLYGMLSFLTAFSFTTFRNASPFVCVTVGSAWVVIASLIAWSLKL